MAATVAATVAVAGAPGVLGFGLTCANGQLGPLLQVPFG